MKKLISIFFLFFMTCGFAGETTITSEESKKLLQEVFHQVIKNLSVTDETYAKYFDKEYIQYVDGKTLNYQDFVAHMKAQKAVMQSMTIEFKHLVAEGDKVASVHLIHGVKKNGKFIEAKVMSVFQFNQDRKLILCDELTELIKGEKSDRDLGSRK